MDIHHGEVQSVGSVETSKTVLHHIDNQPEEEVVVGHQKAHDSVSP